MEIIYIIYFYAQDPQKTFLSGCYSCAEESYVKWATVMEKFNTWGQEHYNGQLVPTNCQILINGTPNA